MIFSTSGLNAKTLGCIITSVPRPFFHLWSLQFTGGFLGGGSGKEPICRGKRHRDMGLIPRLRRPPGGGHGNPLQYYCLENSMDRGAWQAVVHRVSQSQIQLKLLSTYTNSLYQAAFSSPETRVFLALYLFIFNFLKI